MGRTTSFGIAEDYRRNSLAKYIYMNILPGMNTTPPAPAEILRQIAHIQRMEPGKLCVMRPGKEGAYYNHQYREEGRAFSDYVPRDQVETIRRNTENYRTFQALVAQYAGEVVAVTRAERLGSKKKPPRASSRRKTGNSKG